MAEAEPMEVDMTLSDVMDIDFNESTINRLLNVTELANELESVMATGAGNLSQIAEESTLKDDDISINLHHDKPISTVDEQKSADGRLDSTINMPLKESEYANRRSQGEVSGNLSQIAEESTLKDAEISINLHHDKPISTVDEQKSADGRLDSTFNLLLKASEYASRRSQGEVSGNLSQIAEESGLKDKSVVDDEMHINLHDDKTISTVDEQKSYIADSRLDSTFNLTIKASEYVNRRSQGEVSVCNLLNLTVCSGLTPKTKCQPMSNTVTEAKADGPLSPKASDKSLNESEEEIFEDALPLPDDEVQVFIEKSLKINPMEASLHEEDASILLGDDEHSSDNIVVATDQSDEVASGPAENVPTQVDIDESSKFSKSDLHLNASTDELSVYSNAVELPSVQNLCTTPESQNVNNDITFITPSGKDMPNDSGDYLFRNYTFDILMAKKEERNSDGVEITNISKEQSQLIDCALATPTLNITADKIHTSECIKEEPITPGNNVDNNETLAMNMTCLNSTQIFISDEQQNPQDKNEQEHVVKDKLTENAFENKENINLSNLPETSLLAEKKVVTRQSLSSGYLINPADIGQERYGTMMDTENEKMNLIQEISKLKLEMNQLKQENTTLILEIHAKEAGFLKFEAEAQQKEAQLRLEYKQLADSITEQSNNEEKLQLIQSENKEYLAKMKKLSGEVMNFKKIMGEYDSHIITMTSDHERMKLENATLQKHLAALESAFSDQNQKYERCKEIIAGYGRNEETLKTTLEKTRQIAIKHEERYDTLKAHATSQLDRAHRDVLALKDSHKTEVSKLTTLIKRLEIKNESLQQTLEQKTAECTALASLCDEMTGGITAG